MGRKSGSLRVSNQEILGVARQIITIRSTSPEKGDGDYVDETGPKRTVGSEPSSRRVKRMAVE